MKVVVAVVLALAASSSFAQSYYNPQPSNGYYNQPRQVQQPQYNNPYATDKQVNGYVKQDGTYVQPYHQTTPDYTKQNNYSTQGNYNPYTGQYGTKKP